MTTNRVTAWLAMIVVCAMAVDSTWAAGSSQRTEPGDTEIVWMRSEAPIQPLRADSPVIEEIYRRTGVRLRVQGIPSSDFTQVARTRLATDDMPDVLDAGFALAREFYDAEVILGLTGYFDVMPDFARLVQEITDTQNYLLEGELYHFPKFYRYRYRFAWGPVIRGDIMEELGLPMPDSFEELFDVLSAMKEAYPDSFPWTARGTNWLRASSFAMGGTRAAGMEYDPDFQGGKWIYGPAYDGYREWISYMNRLYTAGILDPDYVSNTNSQWQEKLGSGQSFFFFDNTTFTLNMNRALNVSQTLDNPFVPVPTMTNSFGQRRNHYQFLHAMNDGAVVSARVRDPEAVMKYINWLYTDEGAELTNFGIEGTHWDRIDGRYAVNPELVQQRMQDSDPWRSHMSTISAGLFGVALWLDERTQEPFMDEHMAWMYEQWRNDPYMVELVTAPPFNAEEMERRQVILTRLDTIRDEFINSFITGTIPLTRFGEFQQTLRDAGVRELEEIYQTAAARLRQ